LLAAQKTALALKHNTLRARVGSDANQPCTAGDMQELAWDDTLAAAAQTYADACVGDHHAKAAIDFGENLFMTLSGSDTSTKVLEDSVQGWYDEYKDTVWTKTSGAPVSKAKADCIDVSGEKCNIGHYFQVIWSKASKIGCGVKSCSSGMTVSGTSYAAGVLLVCRYDKNPPGADLMGQPPYLFGSKCAGCSSACSTSPAGLCTAAATRCVDKTIAITIDKKYTKCADLVAYYHAGHATPWCTQLAGVMKATDSCPLTCKTCTVPSGMGSDKCGAGSGTSASNTTGSSALISGSISNGPTATLTAPALLSGVIAVAGLFLL